jgi:hypothetical protein
VGASDSEPLTSVQPFRLPLICVMPVLNRLSAIMILVVDVHGATPLAPNWIPMPLSMMLSLTVVGP